MIRKIRKFFWTRKEALEILRIIRRERMLYMKHYLFRDTIQRIQSILN